MQPADSLAAKSTPMELCESVHPMEVEEMTVSRTKIRTAAILTALYVRPSFSMIEKKSSSADAAV